MNLNSAQQDKIEMVLKQMGAHIQSIHGILSYVKINFGDTTVSYVYNINMKNQFFLQRVTPYPLGAGTFNNQNEVLDYIKQDIENFKNAYNSRVFGKFTEVAYRTHRLNHDLEEIFLSCNVPMERMEKIESYIQLISDEIQDIKIHCPKIVVEEND